MAIKTVTFKEYTRLFYKGLPDRFRFQATPIQLYSLEQVAGPLITPTPLVRAEF